MNRSRVWLAIGGAGFAALAISVMMAFLADHHWLVTYRLADVFDGMWGWVQLAGVVLSVIGCIRMAVTLSQRAQLVAGSTLILIGLFLPLLFGGVLAILNVHDWKVSLLLPELFVLLNGAILGLHGALRLAVQRR